jgi:AcrR family transcriptional regulator
MPTPTRKRILEGAIELLRKDGPLEVRPFALAATTGVSASLIAYHFPVPEDIIAQAAITHLKALEPMERSVLDDSESHPTTPLEGWLHYRLAWSRRNPGVAAVLASPHAFGLERFEEWHAVTRSIIDGLIPHVITHNSTSISTNQAREIARLIHKIGLIDTREQEETTIILMIRNLLNKQQD